MGQDSPKPAESFAEALVLDLAEQIELFNRQFELHEQRIKSEVSTAHRSRLARSVFDLNRNISIIFEA